MVGRVSLTPGRVLALAGAVAAICGMYRRVPESGTVWETLGTTGRAGVIAGVAMLVAAVFRPERGRAVEVAGVGVEHTVTWAAVGLAATHAGSLLLVAGASAMVAGASWDLVAAWGRVAARRPARERTGVGAPAAPAGAGISEPVR